MSGPCTHYVPETHSHVCPWMDAVTGSNPVPSTVLGTIQILYLKKTIQWLYLLPKTIIRYWAILITDEKPFGILVVQKFILKNVCWILKSFFVSNLSSLHPPLLFSSFQDREHLENNLYFTSTRKNASDCMFYSCYMYVLFCSTYWELLNTTMKDFKNFKHSYSNRSHGGFISHRTFCFAKQLPHFYFSRFHHTKYYVF